MARRQCLILAVGGPLTFAVPEAGTIAASPTVDLFDATGATIATGLAATITQTGTNPATLSRTVTSGQVSVSGENYRARWRFSIGSLAYQRESTFDVAPSAIYPLITTAAQLAEIYPLLEGREFPGVVKQATIINGVAWDDVLDALRALKKNPNHIVDPSPLLPVHAAWAAARIATNLGPGNAQTNPWQQWATDRLEEGAQRFSEVLAALRWLDENGDLIPDAGEQNVGISSINDGR